MILDELNEFADATTIPTATGVHLIGDVIDLQVARNIGVATLFLGLSIDTAVTSGGSATIDFRLVSDAQAAINSSATIHLSTGPIGKAALVKGFGLYFPLPLEGHRPYERYLGIQAVVGGAALSAGKLNAFLTPNPTAWKAYADAQN